MSDQVLAVPQKKYDYLDAVMDSKRWDGFPFRDDDIVIGTWAKSGTTWCQQIVTQLIHEGQEQIATMDIAPWVDMRIIPYEPMMEQLEAQTHRRCLKTHLPADALVMSPRAKYIYLARDGRDVVWSWYNHLMIMKDEFYDLINSLPGNADRQHRRPTVDIRQFFHDWLDNDAAPFWPYWTNIQTWWDIRHLSNVKLLHYNDLKADLPGEMRRIAEFLGIPVDEAKWPAIVEHCTFDYMKENAEVLSPALNELWEGGMKSFINKGTNNRWRDVLTAEEIQKYEDTVRANLSPDCAAWLAVGSSALR
jgi:aryl sulfotransferase